MELILSVIQLLYLDGKVLLDQELVLPVLSVNCIFEMLKWKKEGTIVLKFGGDNVFVKKTLILVTV